MIFIPSEGGDDFVMCVGLVFWCSGWAVYISGSFSVLFLCPYVIMLQLHILHLFACWWHICMYLFNDNDPNIYGWLIQYVAWMFFVADIW